ncbi:DUF6915 family protein [Hyphomicrobium sp. DY-1]|jgi:hypothetical protein|uniref:DUF6915 family protein n=1 Tax=Hyphomicrobium sp. DY-1 TaxID=3075650 RepID=UPI0039C3211E
MANAYHHAVSSSRQFGGSPDDYQHIHAWFDASKDHLCDFRHRALRHHAQGIEDMVAVFGPTLTLSTGKVIPTRWVGEQHVREDLGCIPTLADWFREIRPQKWMGASKALSRDLEAQTKVMEVGHDN